MTNLCLVFRVPTTCGVTLEKLQNEFRFFAPKWFFNNEYFHFSTEVKHGRCMDYTGQLDAYEELLTYRPDNVALLETYEKLKQKAAQIEYFESKVCLSVLLPYTANEEKNEFIHDDFRKINLLDDDYEQKVEDMFFRLDDFCLTELASLCFAIQMAMVLAFPYIDLSLTVAEVCFNDEFSKTIGHASYLPYSTSHEAYKQYGHMFNTSLSISKAFNWIENNTDLLYANKQNIPFSSLAYAFCRGAFESLMHSIIGLEHLYTSKKRDISSSLKNRIKCVFPQIQEHEIKKMYDLRSDFVHGRRTMLGYATLDDIDMNNYEEDVAKTATYAAGLLLASLRTLIISDSSGFEFSETVSYELIPSK